MDQPTSLLKGALLAKIGVAMQAAVPLAVIATVAGMRKGIDALSTEGTGDPAHLSSAIGGVLGWTFAGVAFCFLGHVLMAISVGISRYRARWFFWAIVISAPLLIPSFPLGTFVFVYALIKWKEFLQPAPAAI